MNSRWSAVILACLGTTGFAQAAEAVKPATSFEVVTHSDIAYRTDKDADPVRHKLDLYLPKGAKDFPVLIFVHGGAWSSGSKTLYMPMGMTFARAGIGTVVVNYRLSPKVKHPAHIEDVAKAFAWTCENIGKYGGRTNRIFVSGHSAGGHLVSLLALDESYLKAVGRSVKDIHGVLAISGVYSILSEVPLFHMAFGKDKTACDNASPMAHVAGKHPPFLIVYAEQELPGLIDMAKDMHAALKKAASDTTLQEIKDRNHISIIVGAIGANDALTVAMREFVMAHVK